MAETRILSLDGQECGPAIRDEFQRARKFGFARVGEQGVFWREGMRRIYQPYAGLRRAFLRIQPIPARVCCGRVGLEQYWVVLWGDAGELAHFEVRDQPRGDAILAAMQANAPALLLGAPEKPA